jgi:hypothetical protein
MECLRGVWCAVGDVSGCSACVSGGLCGRLGAHWSCALHGLVRALCSVTWRAACTTMASIGPLATQVCATPEACLGSRGYKAIALSNPLRYPVGVVVNGTEHVRVGGRAACPPHCPGSTADSAGACLPSRLPPRVLGVVRALLAVRAPAPAPVWVAVLHCARCWPAPAVRMVRACST